MTGTSVRKVDNLVQALGADTGISKSEVSRICADLDEHVLDFADRSLAETTFPYVFLDATYCKARVGGARNGKGSRVVSQAVVIATGVRADGWREVLGFAVGDSEDGAFWTAFLRSLKARGLAGTKLVISDAHAGLKAAISAVMLGATWQRCRVHFLRNVLAAVPKGSQTMVAAAVRTVFAQPDAEHVREQLEVIATMLGRQFPKVESMLREAADEITAFADFPVAHWKKIWSTNPLERVNKEIKRRTDGARPCTCTCPSSRRGLPQPHSPAPPSRLRPDRSPRRMADHRTPLPLRRLHVPNRRPTQPTGGGHPRTRRVIVRPQPREAEHNGQQLHHNAGRHHRGPALRSIAAGGMLPRGAWPCTPSHHHARTPHVRAGAATPSRLTRKYLVGHVHAHHATQQRRRPRHLPRDRGTRSRLSGSPRGRQPKSSVATSP